MIDDELRALIAADPSPDFAARVRERIRADRRQPPWIPRVILAVAAAMIALVLTWPWSSRDGVVEEALATLPFAPAIEGLMPLQATVAAVPPLRPARERAAAAMPSQPRGITAVTRGDVQFDPAELRALQQLFASGLDVPIDLPATQASTITIEAVSIEPLRFEPITEGARQ